MSLALDASGVADSSSALAGELYDDRPLRREIAVVGHEIGSPKEWREALGADLDALRGPVPLGGFTFSMLWPDGMPLAEGLEGLELFASEVLPWPHDIDDTAATA